MKQSDAKVGTVCGKMGLSLVTVLQQKNFLSLFTQSYILKKVGNTLIIFKNMRNKAKRTTITNKQLLALQSKKLTGILSLKSQKNMVQIIQNWQDTIDEMNWIRKQKGDPFNKQLVMLTLTLSSKQIHDDRYIKRHFLAYYIQTLLKKQPDLHYLWKAESQKNGNIHFHLLLDQYFSKEYLRFTWNKILLGNGYEQPTEISQNNAGAPSTRVESLRDVNNAAAYAAKYVSKNEGDRPILGRLWGCSDKLKILKPIEYQLDKEEMLHILNVTVPSLDRIHAQEYCVNVRYPVNWNLVKDSLYNNKTAQLATWHNIDLMRTRKFNPKLEVTDTDWYSDCEKELGAIGTSYMHAQGQLFPDYMDNIIYKGTQS